MPELCLCITQGRLQRGDPAPRHVQLRAQALLRQTRAPQLSAHGVRCQAGKGVLGAELNG